MFKVDMYKHELFHFLTSSLPLAQHLNTQAILAFVDGHLLNSLDEIKGDAFTDHTVLVVLLVLGNKVSDPFGSRPELARRTLTDKLQIPSHLAADLDIDVDAGQITFDQGNQTGEAVDLAVHDFIDGHEEGVLAEPEFLFRDCVAKVCRLHILGRLLDGNIEVFVEDNNRIANEEMSKVRGQQIVHATIDELLLHVGINYKSGSVYEAAGVAAVKASKIGPIGLNVILFGSSVPDVVVLGPGVKIVVNSRVVEGPYGLFVLVHWYVDLNLAASASANVGGQSRESNMGYSGVMDRSLAPSLGKVVRKAVKLCLVDQEAKKTPKPREYLPGVVRVGPDACRHPLVLMCAYPSGYTYLDAPFSDLSGDLLRFRPGKRRSQGSVVRGLQLASTTGGAETRVAASGLQELCRMVEMTMGHDRQWFGRLPHSVVEGTCW
ncbi:hypothetical protein KCV06_g92, partial [Aureobasidium melanogenum]